MTSPQDDNMTSPQDANVKYTPLQVLDIFPTFRTKVLKLFKKSHFGLLEMMQTLVSRCA
jgi:hypothetical protein